jgi:hypothetical protein
MRRLVAFCAAFLPVVALLACSGRLDSIPGGGGGSSSGGGSGSSSGSSGSSSGSSSGGDVCPAPSSVTNDVACSPNGMACPSSETVSDCNGSASPLTCVCEGGQWFCDGPGCPPPACPVAQDVAPGGSCFVSSNVSCASNTPFVGCDGKIAGYLQCLCNGGQWSCPEPPMFCPVDAGAGCPSPHSIAQGAPCSDPGGDCPGNPQVCDGQVDYDAFQCQNGVWVDVAQTVCASDGGGHGG